MGYLEIVNDVQRIACACGREEITVVAVSKGREIHDLYDQGCRLFGESRLQEALPKIAEAPKDIAWHLIGTLQKNKVRKALPLFQLIHSVDTPELAVKISECSQELGLTTHILLQVNTSQEESKHGLTAEEWRAAFDGVKNLPALSIDGLMTIGPRTGDPTASFASLRELRDELKLKHLSMGMSNDYPLAIREGATILRIGSALFSK